MRLVETDDKYSCDECGDYTYLYKLYIEDKIEYCPVNLCKKCLLNLLKLIIER
jgi:hypothetical protein